MLFSGIADVCEWFDDGDQRFHIESKCQKPRWGPLFGYRGSFEIEWWKVNVRDIPSDIPPVRCEQRE
jgi:hypothetical protein